LQELYSGRIKSGENGVLKRGEEFNCPIEAVEEELLS
jgi:hypothetical protein